MTFIQIPDTVNSDLTLICGYTFDEPEFSANEFLIVEDSVSERQYFGQVISPQANLNRSALGPLDNATINAFEQLERENYSRDVVVREVYYYQINLIKDISTIPPGSIRRRPQIGSIARSASQEEIIRYLNLPPRNEEYSIGEIIDTNIDIYIDQRSLFYQTLLAGATGSGKTNSCANYISSALSMGFSVIIYDHKPDYQHINRPNRDIEDSPDWIRGVDADFYYLGTDSDAFQGTSIAIPASNFDPAILASVIYYPPNETNPREEFETLLEEFDDEQQANRSNEERAVWTLRDFYQWVTSYDPNNPQGQWQAPAHRRGDIDKRTYKSMVNKMLRRNRRPDWVDGGMPVRPQRSGGGSRQTRPNPSASVFNITTNSQQPQWFDPSSLIQPGRALVIRVGSAGGGRDYGLFLNFMLKRIYELKDQRQITFPILHHIDEAQDLFNGSKQFATAIGNILSEGVRKGRSRQIAFSIAVQSAAQVPDDILNNLNSRIIHRHNRSSEAQRALEKATKAQVEMTRNFGPGEALVDIFGSSAVVNARMRQSPFQLTTEELLQEQEQGR